MIRIVAGTYEGLLYGWELIDNINKKPAQLKMIFGYSAHSECIKSVALMEAKQGKTLLSGSSDEMIKIYNINKRVEVGTLMEQHGAITSLKFFGQSHVLSGSSDNTICIWRISDWNCLHILGGHKGEINDIAIHPTGKLAFSVAKDRTLRMWNLVKGRIAYIRRLEKEASLVLLSQSGNRYALCFGNDLTVFNSSNAENIGTLEHPQRIHAAAFASDDLIVCAGEDKTLYVWKVTSTTGGGQLVAKVTHKDLDMRIRCLQIVQVEKDTKKLPLVVVATSNGVVQVWDLEDLKLDALAPEESNANVQPMASTKLLSKARLTCLSVCVASAPVEERIKPQKHQEEEDAEFEEKLKEKKSKKQKAENIPVVAPRVVVELGENDSKGKKRQVSEHTTTTTTSAAAAVAADAGSKKSKSKKQKPNQKKNKKN